MTNPRRRPLPGHRDAERLLDAHGRHGRRADGHEELARLLADATAPAYAVDPLREHDALAHFRAAARRPQPTRRSVRQRVAALSATAKVLTIAVGATATGGVAIASTSMPLPLTGDTRSHAAAPAIPRPAGTGQRPGPTGTAGGPSSTATAGTAGPGERGRPGGTPRARHDRRHGRGVVPGLPGTGPRRPDDGGRTPTPTPTGGPTTAPTTPPGTDPPISFPPPTTDPPISRGPTDPPEEPPPDYELPPGFEETPTPTPTGSDEAAHPTPTPTPTPT
jgi:hypothetical protein